MSEHMWHFACDHSAPFIVRDGFVRPSPVPWVEYDRLLGEPYSGLEDAPTVAWFTDLVRPSREAVGLTMTTIGCDRMANRFEVDPRSVIRWDAWANAYHANPKWRADLEEFGQPEHWFVAEHNVLIRPVSVPVPEEDA